MVLLVRFSRWGSLDGWWAMKKLFVLLVIISIPAVCFSGSQQIKIMLNMYAATSGTTDYSSSMSGYWRMNSSSTPEVDRSGNSEDLYYSNTPVSTVTVPSGWSGKALDFERADADSIQHDDGGSTDIIGADQAISLGAWFITEDNTNDQVIIAKGTAGADNQYFLRYDTGDDAFYCAMASAASTQTIAVSATGASDGVPIRVDCVYNDTDIRIYINGSLDSNGAANPKAYTSGIYDGGGKFRIGSYGGSMHMDGILDDVYVTDIALSAAQVLDIATNGVDGAKGGND
jgi:hypothetical protein